MIELSSFLDKTNNELSAAKERGKTLYGIIDVEMQSRDARSFIRYYQDKGYYVESRACPSCNFTRWDFIIQWS
jgi:hypothetical protein